MVGVINRECMDANLLALIARAESDFEDFWYNVMDDRDRELSAEYVSSDTCDAVVVFDGRLYEFASNEQTGRYVVFDLGVES
jgi:hypothetical protein